jgi:hypothetical protein
VGAELRVVVGQVVALLPLRVVLLSGRVLLRPSLTRLALPLLPM